MAEKKFEEAMRRLEEIVQSLEEGQLPLEEALKVFEEGMVLAKLCSKKLEEAEKKVALLVQESEGKYVRVPFDVGREDPEGEG
jgi:exodeoxyribonuclease VII small subunit